MELQNVFKMPSYRLLDEWDLQLLAFPLEHLPKTRMNTKLQETIREHSIIGK